MQSVGQSPMRAEEGRAGRGPIPMFGEEIEML
jgi:hypothetical protein